MVLSIFSSIFVPYFLEKTTYILLMKRLLFTLITTFYLATSFAADHFWIGGSGDWSDIAHWSATSGGPAGTTIPGVLDNAIFDASSGVTAGVVNFDVAVNVDTLDFSNVLGGMVFSSTTFEPSIQINGSLLSNGLASFTWTGIINMIPAANQSILSNGQLWTNVFEINGSASVNLTDNFSSNTDFRVAMGGLNTTSFDFQVQNFFSNYTSTRILNFNNSNIDVNGILWTIDSTNLTFSAASSIINMNNIGASTFNGGHQIYDTIISDASNLSINHNNTFSYLSLIPSSTLNIENGSNQSIDSLNVQGTCAMPMNIISAAGASGQITKTGIATFSASNLSIDNVIANGPALYNIASSDTINGATGWTLTSTDFYWIGGTGVWSDGAHWSFTSGGAASGCIPDAPDNVFIDALSGTTFSIDMDVPVTIQSLDFSGSVGLTLNSVLPSIELRGSLFANAGTTITWTGDINMNPSTAHVVQSNGLVWNNDFVFIGTSDISINDDFASANNIDVQQGTLIGGANNISFVDFFCSTLNTKSIDFNNSVITASGTNWSIDPSGLTWSSTPSNVSLTNITTINFDGGGQVYDSVYSSAATLEVTGDNIFTLLSLTPSSELTLANGSLLSADSLIANGSCGLPMIINTTVDSLTPASFSKTGFNTHTSANVSINNVVAIAPSNYSLQLSDTSNNATGWSFEGVKMYWIGNAGNWSDGNHWSLSSGGAPLGCIPTSADSVYFDLASFSFAGVTVTVDSIGYFGYMDWTGIGSAQTLLLSENLNGYGNVVLDNNLSLLRDIAVHSLSFNEASTLTPNGSTIDASFVVKTPLGSDIVQISNDLVMSDSSSITLFNGTFNTQNNIINTGTFSTANDPTSGADSRTINLGSSEIEIYNQFYSLGDSALTFNAGTSHITIGDDVNFLNSLITDGITFNDVTLNWKPYAQNQVVAGSNTFNVFEITPGSRVHFDSTTIQTVNDSLILEGNCLDSIFIGTAALSPSDVAFINKATTTTDVIAEFLNISGMDASSGQALTALFSTDLGSNNAITFSTTDVIDVSFATVSGLSSFCYGDTVHFNNTSTSHYTAFNDLEFDWYLNDGSLPDDNTLGHIEAEINSAVQFDLAQTSDTTEAAYDQLIGWTEITDGMNLFAPAIGEVNTTPQNQDMRFDFKVGYRLSLNNTSADSAYLVDMESDPLDLFYNYKPKFKIYKNGQDTPVSYSGAIYDDVIMLEDTVIPAGINEYGSDTVTFSIIAPNIVQSDILTLYAGIEALYNDTMIQPRWKDTGLISGNNVTVDFRLDIDTIYFEAFPISYTYTSDTLSHVVETSGDSIPVTLTVTDPYTMCAVTDTAFINVIRPNVSMLTSEPDLTVCPWDSVQFEAYSSVPDSVAITSFEFYYNGVSQNTPSANDTLFTLYNLNDGDSISVLAYQGGCVSDTFPSYNYTLFDQPSFNWTSSDADTSICIFDNVDFVATHADSIYQYQFFVNDVPGTLYQDSTGYFSTSTLADNDTVDVVGLNDRGCMDTLTMIFNVDPLPVTVLSESSGGNVICANESVTFTGSGSDQYEFYVNGDTVQALSTTATWTTTSLAFGDTVSLLGVNNNGCLQHAAETFTYIVNTLPPTSLAFSDLDSTICSGDEVIFTASGAIQYEFFINGTSQGALSPTTVLTSTTLAHNDTIYVEGTSGGCSLISDSIIMEVLTSPTTTLTDTDPDNSICYGENVTFTATGASTYEFFVDGISQGLPSATNTFSTTGLINGQTVSVNGESNTCIITQQSSWVVLNNPVVDLFSSSATNTVCIGDPITFTGANASQYDFLINGTTVQGPSTDASLVNPTFAAGANEVQVVGTAGNGCTDSSSVIIVTANSIPTITATSSDANDEICAGESVTFTGSGGDMYQFYLNGTPQGALSSNSTFTTTSLTNGQVLTIEGQLLGCPNTSNSITTTVNAVPAVTLNATDNVFCIDELVTYTATGATNYEFLVDGVSQGAPSATNTLNSTGFIAGTYPVQVTGETNGCTNSTSLSVTVHDLPMAAITSSSPTNTICSGDFVTYTATGGSLFEFFVNGASQGSPSPSNTLNSNSLTTGDVVSVEVSDITGCSNTDAYAAITVNLTPVTTLTSSDINNEFCIGENVTYTAAGATEYEFFIDGVSQGPASTTATLSSTTIANGDIVQVIGTSLGCTNTSSAITNIVFGLPVVTVINNNETQICVGENVDLVASGATNYQFLVNGTPVAPFSATNTFNGVVNDGDVVTISGETNGCPNLSADVFTYTVYNYPTLSSTSSDANNEICINENVDFNASGAMTYDFSLNGVSQLNGPTTLYSTNTLQDGDVITITGFNGDCPSTVDSYTFVVHSMPLTLSVSPSTMVCEGEPVTFTGAGGDNYEFFLNGVSTGPMSATNNYLTSTLNDGDEVSMQAESTTTGCLQVFDDYILMNVIDEPTISPLSSITFCEGDSVILVSNSSYGNQWLLNGTPIAGATDTSLTVFDSGTYSLETTAGGTGTVWSFGHNAFGSFSDGTNLNNSEPTSSTSDQIFTEISSGYEFVLGVNDLNEVYAWGENSSGQLGDGTYTNSNQAQIVPTITNIKTVATSESSSMAVSLTGDVYVWGNNTEGQLGTGNNAVINFPFQNTSLSNTDSIAGGKTHFVILRNDGTVATVGNNDYGQLGQNNLTSSNSPVVVPGLTNVVSVGAGEYHSFAIDANGDLYVWGNNGSGQLGLDDLTNRLIPTISPLKNVTNAQGGATHSAFVTSNGKVFTTGSNIYGQLGNGTFNDETSPIEVNLQGAKSISTGQYTTLVQRNDNSVFGFGNNTEEQLSSNTGLLVNTPEHISDIDGVTFIEAGKSSSHFIYGSDQSCASVDVNTVMNVVPVITITESNDILTTIAADTYQWYFEGNPIPGSTSQSHTANASGNYHVEVTLANGCSGTSEVYFHGMAGIDEISIGSIALYPNPTKSDINLRIDNALGSKLSISIIDQTGRIVQNSEHGISDVITINVIDIEAGVYYLQLQDDLGNEKTMKFIKSHD